MKTLFLIVCFFLPKVVSAQELTLPFNIGVGPTLNWVTGPVANDQTFHYGIRFNTYIAIDKKARLKHIEHIPQQYRKMAREAGELRYDPTPWYLPRSVMVSPKFRNTGMYGLTLRPLGLGLAIGEFKLSAGLLLSYIFIHSDSLPSVTHFLRPGTEVKASLELPLDPRRRTTLSLEWASQFYIPQNLGEKIFVVGDLDASIWHIGQVTFMIHRRVDLRFNLGDYL